MIQLESQMNRIAPATATANSVDMRLTVIVPVFNEARTVLRVLRRTADSPDCDQIVVIDDGSRDDTPRITERWLHDACISDAVLVRRSLNRGKGASIRTGLAYARGEIVVIQDADLEYDPSDYAALVEPIRTGRCDAVYGARVFQRGAPAGSLAHRLCRRLLNAAVWLLYGRRIGDEATGYKAFRTDLLRRLELRCERFEFCPEVTAKLCRLGIAIH